MCFMWQAMLLGGWIRCHDIIRLAPNCVWLCVPHYVHYMKIDSNKRTCNTHNLFIIRLHHVGSAERKSKYLLTRIGSINNSC